MLLLDNCRWLDKLGVSAKEGMGVVMRQTFSGGRYGLTDKNNMPNPVSFEYSLSDIFEFFSIRKFQ